MHSFERWSAIAVSMNSVCSGAPSRVSGRGSGWWVGGWVAVFGVGGGDEWVGGRVGLRVRVRVHREGRADLFLTPGRVLFGALLALVVVVHPVERGADRVEVVVIVRHAGRDDAVRARGSWEELDQLGGVDYPAEERFATRVFQLLNVIVIATFGLHAAGDDCVVDILGRHTNVHGSW